MADALYSRIEAIESFAADVAHELKNPLTSLRSAVETLPLARNDESRARLLSVIQQSIIMHKNGAKIELFDNLKSLFARRKPQS